MNALKLNDPYELMRLRTGLQARIKATATLGGKDLTLRRRNTIIRALESGYLDINPYRGTGLLASRLLAASGAFHVTRNWALTWDRDKAPKGFEAEVQRILTADVSATEVAGRQHRYPKVRHHEYQSMREASVNLFTLNPKDHIPPLLKEHVATPEYKAAVKPFIDMLKAGEDIVLTIQ